MLRTHTIATVALLIAGAATSAHAADVSVPALKDAMIFGSTANVDTGNASGKGPALFAGADGSLNRKRSLLEFDLAAAGIPAGSTITGVTMSLWLGQVAGSGGGQGGGTTISPRVFNVYRLLQDWGEGTSGAPTSGNIGGSGQGYARVAGDSTWDYAIYDPLNLNSGRWNSSGTDLHGGNFNSTPSATVSFASPYTTGTQYNFSSAGMAADVQAWLDGSLPNFGWLIQTDLETTATSFLGFWSKDGAAANIDAGSNPPMLNITYVPEPAAMFIGGVVGSFAMARRRRFAKTQ